VFGALEDPVAGAPLRGAVGLSWERNEEPGSASVRDESRRGEGGLASAKGSHSNVQNAPRSRLSGAGPGMQRSSTCPKRHAQLELQICKCCPLQAGSETQMQCDAWGMLPRAKGRRSPMCANVTPGENKQTNEARNSLPEYALKGPAVDRAALVCALVLPDREEVARVRLRRVERVEWGDW
jgi:hypothetical protein